MIKLMLNHAGGKLMVVGITRGNIDRLLEDQPILLKLDELGPMPDRLCLFAGEDQADLLDQMSRHLNVELAPGMPEPGPGETIIGLQGR